MNAPPGFEVSPAASHGKAPDIVVRDRRFGRGQAQARWWLNGDPVGTAWFNALSATFPRGETLFVDAVRSFREGAPPQLAAEVRAFVKQEIHHTREHLAFNRAAEAAGYDLSVIDARVERLIGDVYARPRIFWLAVTIALEHFTAMFAHEFLEHPEHFVGADVEQAELWRWHAVEELEHKGVAYDTWLHATRGWSRWRRWKVKSVLMLVITRRFIRNRLRDATELLAQDGIAGSRATVRLVWYLVGKPGILRRVFPAWCAYFAPGFHPWNRDDRHLIGKYDSDYAAAALG
jgi:predicted metal-dependent hydrolase